MIARTFHRLVGLLAGVAARWPRLAMHGADLLGLLLPERLRIDDVRALLPLANARRIVRQTQARRARDSVLLECMSRTGIGPMQRLVRKNAAIAALRPSMVVGTFHVGPTPALSVAVEQLSGPVFAIRRTELAMARAANVTVETAVGDEQRRALAFHRALEQLRNGGFVFMALDPEHAYRIEVPFLGRKIQLARGGFAMARLARVPIVPMIARWRGTDVEVIVGEPIAADDDEQVMAAAAARWLERYVLDNPEELSPRIVELVTG